MQPAAIQRTGGSGVTPPRRSLLALDPDLGQLLAPDRRQAAERDLLVRVSSVSTGEWDGARRLAGADPGHLGLLVVEGVMAREVVVGDTVSTELLGVGDVIRPWHLQEDLQLLPVEVRWNALAPLRLAILDRGVATVLGRFPEVNSVLIDRLSERAQRLSVMQAICQLNRVDRRLIALFWLLASRWGRVVPDGVVVPLALSHRVLGQLIGARRPSVSTALAQLARERRLARRADGTWQLHGQPVDVPAPVTAEVVRQRRRLVPLVALPADADDPVIAVADPKVRGGAATAVEPPPDLSRSIEAALETSREQGLRLRALCDETLTLRERLAAQRARRRSSG